MTPWLHANHSAYIQPRGSPLNVWSLRFATFIASDGAYDFRGARSGHVRFPACLDLDVRKFQFVSAYMRVRDRKKNEVIEKKRKMGDRNRRS